jgi:hypothetical protein
MSHAATNIREEVLALRERLNDLGDLDWVCCFPENIDDKNHAEQCFILIMFRHRLSELLKTSKES